MKQVLVLAAFLSSSAAIAQAPGVAWENEYLGFAYLGRMALASGNSIVVAGTPTDSSNPGCVHRFDLDGNLIWSCERNPAWTYQGASDIEILPSGSIAVCGVCTWSGGAGFAVYRLSNDGSFEWGQSYLPSSWVCYDMELLPDGGYAICGATTIQPKVAFVMRVSSSGEELWRRTWECPSYTYPDVAIDVKYIDGGLTALVDGRPVLGSDNRPVLLRYSMDGDLLWELYSKFIGMPNDLCLIQPNGYALLRRPSSISGDSSVYLLDSDGNVIGEFSISAYYHNDMRTVSQTFDGGFLVVGSDYYSWEWNNPWHSHISRYAPDGEPMWAISTGVSQGQRHYIDGVQLPQGGYIASGWIDDESGPQRALLTRYEPETGLEQPPLPSSLVLESCVPNPGAATFSLSWSSDLSGSSAVRVYDVSGRLRLDQDLGLTPAGEQIIQLDLKELPSGCYLVVVSCGPERASTKLVVLR